MFGSVELCLKCIVFPWELFQIIRHYFHICERKVNVVLMALRVDLGICLVSHITRQCKNPCQEIASNGQSL